MRLSEFTLIDKYFRRSFTQRQDVVLGIGDDAAVVTVPPGMDLIMTIDTLVEGVHFTADMPAEDLGYKCLAVNLSDLAAMGAAPTWVTLSLSLPEAKEPWLAKFSKGFFELADHYGVALIGGDTSRGPLVITVQAHGLLPKGTALRRSTAQVGDHIYVTGTLGDAALGLDLVLGKIESQFPQAEFLIQRLHRPTPRINEGIALRGMASSAIDISDGLIADLGHILTASRVGATLYVDNLPVSQSAQAWPDPQQVLEYTLSGGDDYELCFTVPHNRIQNLESLGLPTPLTYIGIIEETLGLRCLLADGSGYTPEKSGYQHF